MCLLHRIAGAFTQPPEELKDHISTKSGDLRCGRDVRAPSINSPLNHELSHYQNILSLDNLGNGLYSAP
jgi:hypothetical protein